MTRYRIVHRTHYDYGATVDLSHHLLRLTPPDTERQILVERRLDIAPVPGAIRSMRDHFGNRIEWITLETIHDALTVEQEATVEVTRRNLDPAAPSPAWEAVRAEVVDDGFPDQPVVAEYVYTSPFAVPVPSVAAYTALSFPAGDRPARPLRLGLSAHIPAGGRRGSARCRRDARLGIGMVRTRSRLGGDGPDERPPGRGRTHRPRLRPRFRRHQPATRRHPGRRRTRAGRRGDGDAGPAGRAGSVGATRRSVPSRLPPAGASAGTPAPPPPRSTGRRAPRTGRSRPGAGPSPGASRPDRR